MINRKKKTCLLCGHPRVIFARGLCKHCNTIVLLENAEDEKLKKKRIEEKRKQLNPDGLKDRKLERLEKYENNKADLIKELIDSDQFFCFFSGVPFVLGNKEFDCHHLDGRVGDKIFRKDNLVFVKREYHMQWHSMGLKWCSEQPWFHGFMTRLRIKNPEYYNKLIIKLSWK